MNYTTSDKDKAELLEQPIKLIQGCINGDRYFQRCLYEQYMPKMLGVCMRYTKNREEAEDVLQDGFVQVFKSLHSFKFEGSFEGWIRKIMVNCAIKHYRTKPKMYPVVALENAQVVDSGTEEIMAYLNKKELLKMVQGLPPAYRMIFNLYVFEGMKHREIAAHLGISEGTSKSNFFDAKLLLRKAVNNSLKIAK